MRVCMNSMDVKLINKVEDEALLLVGGQASRYVNTRFSLPSEFWNVNNLIA